ncbi:MAG: tyrosine-type recombinase/integrase [Prevotella sp.]|nr:tyrosine-type recombinase/integrase [Prevotella sp.]
MSKKINSSSSDPANNEIKGYSDPQLVIGKRNYIYFYAFDPISGLRKRKKYYLGRCRSRKEMQRVSRDMIRNISRKLEGGWNPWIEQSDSLTYTLFSRTADLYHDFLYKRLNDRSLREDTVISYISYLKVFREWVEQRNEITYMFQLDHLVVSRFLDYVYVERNNTFVTRNNYLAWLRSFTAYLLERGYLQTDPCAQFHHIKIKGYTKERTIIPDEVLVAIRNYLEKHNRHFLLACYLTHYMCIRPKELSRLRVGDINIGKCTITLHSDQTKNHDSITITMPQKVARLMIDLDIFSAHGGCYLFSSRFMPGEEQKSEKAFRDYWSGHLRRDLKFSTQYVYYSLKDTGITNMLRSGMDPISVRDQARHSSLAITNTYTPLDIKNANPLMLKYEGLL